MNCFALVSSLTREKAEAMCQRLIELTGLPIGWDEFISRPYFYTDSSTARAYMSCVEAWLSIVDDFRGTPDNINPTGELTWSWLTPDGFIADPAPMCPSGDADIDEWLWKRVQPDFMIDCCDYME